MASKELEKFVLQYFAEIEKAIALAVDKILKKEVKKLTDLIKERAVQGIQGKTGSQGLPGKPADEINIIAEILKQIPKPDQNKIIEEIKKQMPEETAKTLRDKLKTLKEPWLEADLIIGLTQAIKKFAARIDGGGGGDTINFRDLSSELDGSTKEFTLTRVREVLGAFATSFPGGGFRPLVDWTYTESSSVFTITGEVKAPRQNQTLWLLVKES